MHSRHHEYYCGPGYGYRFDSTNRQIIKLEKEQPDFFEALETLEENVKGKIMHISTKKGDSGFTSLLKGQRVPKHHLIIEAGGILDETNSLLGVARASSQEKRIKRIILQIQKHLFVIGAELSVPKSEGKASNKRISETDIKWLERLVDEFEEALALPPGFVAFGQNEGSSHLDVARTSVRNAERMASKMKSEDLIENTNILKYLNRLSDLIFLLACFEEKEEEEKRANPLFRKWGIVVASIFFMLIVTIVLLLFFHRPAPQKSFDYMQNHMKQMENMH
jgi:cob(I)alamin adenosyltransferase